MNIKNIIKKSKNNDVFVKKIHSEKEEFDGKYFIFIRSTSGEYLENDKYPMFRVKITNSKEIPKTLEEINNSEYVQLDIAVDLYSIDRQKEGFEKKKKLEVDEYGFLSIYRRKFIPYIEKKYPEDLIYIGNFEVNLPENEYIFNDALVQRLTFWDEVDKDIISAYELYNKKDSSIYNPKFSKLRRDNYLLNKQIHEEVVRDSERILKKYGKEIEEILSQEPYIEDSLTYVGKDEEMNDNS